LRTDLQRFTRLLSAIYEEDFLGFSVWVRMPTRHADGDESLLVGMHQHKGELYSLDADIGRSYDAVSQAVSSSL